MTVGRLRRRYSVRERATTRDARGELADVFTEKFKVWGEPPREGSTSNYADAGAQRSEDTMRFRVRWRTGIEIGD